MPTRPASLTPPRSSERERKRQSSLPPQVARLYSTAAWTRRSKAHRAAEPWCRMCKAMGVSTKATVADHIERATDAESFWIGPLQSLCWSHHQTKRQAESRGKVWKPRMGCDAQGMPLDPEHPWRR